MTPEILAWGLDVIDRYNLTGTRTIELGAYNVNGSLRQFLEVEGSYYLGVDQFPGPGVGHVSTVAGLPDAMHGTFTTVVCTEMLEHDLTFWVSLRKAFDLLCSGGMLLLSTCGNGFPRHDYPSDYYRFSTDALAALLAWVGFEVLETAELDGQPTVTAVARKP